jgi:hypothetical protein
MLVSDVDAPHPEIPLIQHRQELDLMIWHVREKWPTP